MSLPPSPPEHDDALRIAMIHLGARLHYMAPAALAQAGALHRLYTDFCVLPGEGRVLSRLPTRLLPRPIRRLLGRRVPPEIPPALVRRYGYSTFRDYYYLRRYPHEVKNAAMWQERRMGGYYLSDRLLSRGFDGANALYVHPCVSTCAIEEAHRRGLPVILEAISHPQCQYVQAGEYERYGQEPPLDADTRDRNLSLFRHEVDLSSLVLAASEYSKSGLIDLGVPESKIRLVPYALRTDYFSKPPSPVRGRVLF
ncbi:MAG: hypothetical protein KDA37_10230, partial [Planctomycetales bacterium]|nr:hypothetical protein [Planctomycetales bacterium]